MEAHLCNHPMVPHTVEYVLSSTVGASASVVRPFDDLESAGIFAQKIIRQNTARLKWLKIFRSDNEMYACFTWENSKRDVSMEENKVKLEVDMNPFKEVFDSVALGFKNQGKAIRELQISQAILSGAFVVTVIINHIHF